VRKEEHDALIEILSRTERPRTSVEERLQLLEDKETIRDLISQYGFLCDAGRWDQLLELYADDIERVLAGTLDERVKGKDKLLQLYKSPVLPMKSDGAEPKARVEAKRDRPGEFAARHLISHDSIRVSDDDTEAWAAVQYSLVLTFTDGQTFDRGAHEGAYVFTFGKIDGAWKFTKMVVIANSAFNPMNKTLALS
jgi:hypothetical protein